MSNATAPKRRATRRTNEERSAHTRSALVESVIQSLCEVGYGRTTMQEIGRRASITTGAMQHHFGSKDELVFAALDRLFDEIVVLMREVEPIATGQVLEGECARVVQTLWTGYYGHPRYVAVTEITVGSRSDHDLHDRVMRHRSKSLSTLEIDWSRIFDLPRSDLREPMRFTLALLRGAAISDGKDDTQPTPAHVQMLSTTLARQIRDIQKQKPEKTNHHGGKDEP